MRYIVLIIAFMVSIISCYREVVIEELDADQFELMVTPETQQFIYDSRDTTYSIEDAELGLLFNAQPLELSEIRVRGRSANKFQRKSYVVFLSNPVSVTDRYGDGVRELYRFKLIALAMDYTYIENRISFGLLEEAGVMPLFYKFVEFKINDQTQGVYLLVEDPESFYLENESEYILRRSYDHKIEDSDYNPSIHFIPYNDYENRYMQIYNSLKSFQGEELFSELSDRISLDLYFRKMGIDYLLKNGDYTDEIYLYSLVNRDTIRFYPIPWDYDDIYSSNPHELGRSWAIGTLFGRRSYESMDDIYADVGKTLIYSIEDDLDYTIARDKILYAYYREELKRLFQVVDEDAIERVFSQTREELSVFYNSTSVIEQSQYDLDLTTKELWNQNMTEMQEFITERLEEIKLDLNMP